MNIPLAPPRLGKEPSLDIHGICSEHIRFDNVLNRKALITFEAVCTMQKASPMHVIGPLLPCLVMKFSSPLLPLPFPFPSPPLPKAKMLAYR